MIDPANVAASPKATSTVSCISPAGSYLMPTNRSATPLSTTIAAMINWIIFACLSFIVFKSGAKVVQKNEATKKWGSVRGTMSRLFNREVVACVFGEGFSLVRGQPFFSIPL